MRSAIAFGMVIVILGIFLPGVIHAMDVFLLVLFDRATALVAALPSTPSEESLSGTNVALPQPPLNSVAPAMMSQALPRR